MNEEVEKMLMQVLSHAKNASDFAAIRARVSAAEAHAHTQPEYWRLHLPGQVKDVAFAEFGIPVLPMQAIVLELDGKEEGEA